MINNSWDELLKDIIDTSFFNELMDTIDQEYKNKIIYPKKDKIFNALTKVTFEEVKVVIIGQDPYHGPNQAHGLSFSVEKDNKIPPSLKNIYKELNKDLNIPIPKHGNLLDWTKEGVLLLNSILTVEEGNPSSHKHLGWEKVTDKVIKVLNNKKTSVVFILWGNYAIKKEDLITNKNHLVIKSSHPSPFSANKGFFNSKPFSKTNTYLIKNNIKPVNWEIKS